MSNCFKCSLCGWVTEITQKTKPYLNLEMEVCHYCTNKMNAGKRVKCPKCSKKLKFFYCFNEKKYPIHHIECFSCGWKTKADKFGEIFERENSRGDFL